MHYISNKNSAKYMQFFFYKYDLRIWPRPYGNCYCCKWRIKYLVRIYWNHRFSCDWCRVFIYLALCDILVHRNYAIYFGYRSINFLNGIGVFQLFEFIDTNKTILENKTKLQTLQIYVYVFLCSLEVCWYIFKQLSKLIVFKYILIILYSALF